MTNETREQQHEKSLYDQATILLVKVKSVFPQKSWLVGLQI